MPITNSTPFTTDRGDLWVCETCGSADVTARVVLNPNEKFDLMSHFAYGNIQSHDCYCNECDHETDLILENSFEGETSFD